MVLGSLLGPYDSDDEQAPDAGKDSTPGVVADVGSEPKAGKAPPRGVAAEVRQDPQESREAHGADCDCSDCVPLLARFAAKNLQTKGIRFRCRLCGELEATKVGAGSHFQSRHVRELQEFKRQKDPNLFAPGKRKAATGPTKKISFSRQDVLGKRPADDDSSFGGWTKKEKPEPPPCETEEYQAMMDPVFTAPPWLTQSKPTDAEATPEDREIDKHVNEAQLKRFSKRNVLEVNAVTVRCKLCYKTLPTAPEAERHVLDAHQDDYMKEKKIWERFLHTTCRRQPPFGWVCKVCNLFFPTDGAVWRHLGKEVYIRREERHLGTWTEKEDRWGHEEDEECCGDGINFARGFSLESVAMFQQEAKDQQNMAVMDAVDIQKLKRRRERGAGESESEDDEDEEPAAGNSQPKLIEEF